MVNFRCWHCLTDKIANSFCCGCSLTVGLVFIAIITLLTQGIMIFALLVIVPPEGKSFKTFGLIYVCLNIPVQLLILLSACTKSPGMSYASYVIYSICNIAYTLLFIGGGAYVGVLLGNLGDQFNKSAEHQTLVFLYWTIYALLNVISNFIVYYFNYVVYCFANAVANGRLNFVAGEDSDLDSSKSIALAGVARV
jgi:hypothetical protein